MSILDVKLFSAGANLNFDTTGNRIGFYKAGDQYIFTSEANHEKGTLETRVDRISKILKEHPIASKELDSYSFEECKTATEFLSSINKLIEKHNIELQKQKESKIIKFLMWIPLINRIVAWWYADLHQPIEITKGFLERIYVRLFNAETEGKIEKISNYISTRHTIENIDEEMKKAARFNTFSILFKQKISLIDKLFNLVENPTITNIIEKKDEFLIYLTEAQLTYAFLDNEIMSPIKKQIAESFEKKLREIVPALAKADEILSIAETSTEPLYFAILSLKKKAILEEARVACNDLLKQLPSDSALPESHKESLSKAVNIVKKAYGHWHSQRINSIAGTAKESGGVPKMEELLGTDDKSLFIKKYNSLLTIFALDPEQCNESLDVITKSYEDYLKGRMNYFLEISRDSKTGIIPSQFLKRDSTLEEITKQLEIHMQLLQEWDAFQKLRLGEKSVPFYNDGMCILQKVLIKEYQMRFPLYAQALKVIEQFASREVDSKGIVSLSPDIKSTVNSESWCERQLTIFELGEQELILSEVEIPPQVTQAFKDACKLLNVRIAYFKGEEIKKRKAAIDARAKTPPGFFSRIFSFFSSAPRNQFLIDHAKVMRELLKIEPTVFIHEEYERFSKEMRKSAEIDKDTKDQLEVVDMAYDNYKRSLEIKPAVTKFLSNNLTGVAGLDGIFRFNRLSIEDLDTEKDRLIKLLDEEIDFQRYQRTGTDLKNIEEILTKTKNQIVTCWQCYLLKYLPAYAKIKPVLDQGRIEGCLYKRLLDVTLYYGQDQVKSKYQECLASFKLLEVDTLPKSVLGDLIAVNRWITIAYKEWEAERLKNAGEGSRFSHVILGLSGGCTTKDKTKRYKELQLLLHPDKQENVPPFYVNKFTEAVKYLSPDLCTHDTYSYMKS